jgi:TonB family protein
LAADVAIFARGRSMRVYPALMLCLGFWMIAQLAFATDRRINFDIPAQPLDRALDAYGAASGFQLFYESALAATRRSNAVKGVFDRETALGILLQGSDLTARSIAPDTMSIAAPDQTDEVLRQSKRASVAYYGIMQGSIMKALCQSAETRPGSYRMAIQYWIDTAGRIANFRLLESSGDKERDDAVGRAIQTIVFQPTLGNIPQPITFAIEPSPPEELAGCMPGRIDSARIR